MFRRRTLTRLSAVQALYQADILEATASAITPTFLTDANRLQENALKGLSKTMFAQLVTGTMADLDTIDDIISKHLSENWSFSRIDKVIKAILRLGTFECLHMSEPPSPIILSEYIDITDSFYDTDEEQKFVNGVLSAIAKTIRPSSS